MLAEKYKLTIDQISGIFSKSFSDQNLKKIHNFGTKNIFVIKWNHRSVLVLFFFTFGFYGWGTTPGFNSITSFTNLSTIFTLFISSMIVFLQRNRFNAYFQGSFSIEVPHLLTVVLFLIIGVAFNIKSLSRSLTVDESAHAWSSQLHAYVLASKIESLYPSLLGNIDSRYVLQSLSFLMLIMLTLFFLLLSRLKTELGFYLSLALSTLAARLLIQSGGGIDWPNSPFGHFWHFLFSSTFGITNTTFRVSNLLLFAIIATIAYFYISDRSILGKFSGFLSGLLVYTVPLLNSLSTSLEIASWSLLFTLICFGSLLRNNFTFSFNLLFLISIGFYFRVNLIALFVALLVCIFVFKRDHIIENKWGLLLPVLIILPGLCPILFSRLLGKLDTQGSSLSVIRSNFENTIGSVLNSGSSLYLILFLVSVLAFFSRLKSSLFLLLYLSLQGFLFLVLNSPLVSGSSKYLVEFFFPLVLIIGMLPALSIRVKVLPVLPIVFALLVVFTPYGLFKSQGIPNTFKTVYDPSKDAISSGFGVIPYTPFPYKEVFRFIGQRNLPLCLNAGVVYSELPRVLTGSTYSQVSSSIKLRLTFLEAQKNLDEDWRTVSNSSLSRAKIECVILGAVDQPMRIQKELLERGWLTTAIFVDNTFGTKVYLMNKK